MLTSWLFKQWPKTPDDQTCDMPINLNQQSEVTSETKWPKKPSDFVKNMLTIMLQTKCLNRVTQNTSWPNDQPQDISINFN